MAYGLETENNKYPQKDQRTNKSQHCGSHYPGLSRTPQCPFPVTHECLSPLVVKCFEAAPGPTGTAVSQLPPGTNRRIRPQYQRTHKSRPRGRHPQGLPSAPKGPYTVPHKRLEPDADKGFHTAPRPTGTAVPQVAPGGGTKSPTNGINVHRSVDLVDANLQSCQELLKTPLISSTRAWHLQSARASTLYLDQQIQPFRKFLWRETQASANRFNKLRNVYLVDTTPKACQELLKAHLLSPESSWHLQLARASTLHLDQ